MVSSAAEPPFERFSSSGQEGAPAWKDLEEQVQEFARCYRGQVAATGNWADNKLIRVIELAPPGSR